MMSRKLHPLDAPEQPKPKQWRATAAFTLNVGSKVLVIREGPVSQSVIDLLRPAQLEGFQANGKLVRG